MIRAAVVGVGHLGRHHARILSSLPEVELVAVADLDTERGAAIAKEYGTRFVENYQDLLGEVETVNIAAPTVLHHHMARQFLDHGVHVLLEKPIACTIEEAQDLVTVAAERDLIFQIGHLERFNPGVVAVKDKIHRPLFIEAHRIGPFSSRSTDVDVIIDLMIHDLDLMLWFVKDTVKNVQAVGVPVLSDQVDIANSRIEFTHGCVANLTASRVSLEPLRKMRIFQRNSYISIDFQKRTSEMFQRDETATVNSSSPMQAIRPVPLQIAEGEPLRLEIESFLGCVCNKTPPAAPGNEACRALELALLIRNSLTKAPEDMVQDLRLFL